MNNKFFIGGAVGSFQNLGKAQPVSKVVIQVDEETAYSAGNDSGYVLTVSNPYGTQQMAQDLLQQAKGFVYQGVKAENIELPPTAELGDGLTVGGVYGILANRVINFSPKFVSDVHTPWSPEVQHRYKYEGTYKRELNKGVKLGQSYFGTRITRKNGLEIVKSVDGKETSMVQLNSDTLAFYDASGNEALYFDAEAGKYRFVGDVAITGGTMNVNNNFIVSATGDVTLNGNVNLSNGKITWGSNYPGGGGGVSESEVKTLITNTLVSSPNIAGAKFWDINQEAYLEMDASYGAGHRFADLRFFQGSSEIFRIAADNTLDDFDLSSGGRVTVALNTIAGMLLYAESVYNGESWSDTIYPQGHWNFRDASTEGISGGSSVPVWG